MFYTGKLERNWGMQVLSFHKFLPVFLFLFVLSTVTPIVLGDELSIETVADTYTERDEPDVNHGGASILYSYYYEYELLGDITSYENHLWLKFDLSEIPSEATVNSIILRMHTSFIMSTTNRVGVFLCSSTDWQEMTITWSNCPEVTGQPIDTVYVGSSDTYYDFDVTSAVKGKSDVTLVLKTLESTKLFGWAIFSSRETSNDLDKPRLIVKYTTPSPPSDTDTTPSSPLDTDTTPSPHVYALLVIGFLAILVVVFIAFDIVRSRKKKQPSNNSSKPRIKYERHGLTWERKTAQTPKQVEEQVPQKTKKEVYCIHCAEKLPSRAVYCRKCGKKAD